MAGAPNNVFPCCLEINLVNVYPTFLWLSSVEEAHERTHCHFWLTLFPLDRTSWTVWIWIEPTWCKCCILYILYYILCTGFPFKKRTGVTVRHGTLKLSTTIQHPRNAFFQSNSLSYNKSQYQPVIRVICMNHYTSDVQVHANVNKGLEG